MTGSGVVARAFLVTGRVQGVGFRWWTRAVAEELELGGSVRNREDGSVEVQAIGRLERVEAFRVELSSGPRFARVDAVEPIEPAAGVDATRFVIEL